MKRNSTATVRVNGGFGSQRKEQGEEMKRIMCALAIITVGLATPRTTFAAAESSGFHARDLKSVSVVSRGGRNVEIVFTTARNVTSEGKPLPRSIEVVINGQHALATDKTGHGSYVVNAETKENFTGSITLDLSNRSPKKLETTTTCTIETVECPPNCKSSIFGAKCIICLKITCVVVIKK